MTEKSDNIESSSTNSTRGRSYWCFISYNHQDNKTEGRQWASWLHQAIETYEVPPDLVGSMNERGEQISSQLFPCFRDEEELAAAADLNRSIYDALDRSRTLLVLCSRHAVESSYVRAEIRYFRKRFAGNKRVFAALLEGTPASSFPPELTEMITTPDGELVSIQGPPLAADFRLADGSQGWTSREAYRQALKVDSDLRNHIITRYVELYGQTLEQAKLQLVAGIIGVPLGVLKARDKAYQLEQSKRKARTLKRWLLVVGSLATIAVLISVVALMQLQTALRSRMAQYEVQSRAYQRDLQAPEALIYGLATIALGRSPFVRFPHLFSSNLSSEKLLAEPTQAIPLHRVMGIGLPCTGFSDVSGIAAFPRRGTLIIADAFRPYICAIHQGVAYSLTTGSGQVAVALTPQAETLLSIGTDGKIRSWDLDSGIKAFTGLDASHLLVDSGERYSAGALTPNGKALIVGKEDGTVLVIDRNGQVLTSPFQAHIGKVSAVAVFPDGESFLTTGDDGALHRWDLAGKRLPPQFEGHSEGVRALAIDGQGKLIATGSADQTIRVWDRTGAQVVGPLRGHRDTVTSLAFSPSGDFLASGSWDRSIRIWDKRGHQVVWPLLGHTEGVVSVFFDTTDRRLVSVDHEGTVRLWDLGAYKPLGYPLGQGSGPVTAVAVSPKGRLIASGSVDRTLRLWDLDRAISVEPFRGHQDLLTAVAFHPSGSQVASASRDGSIRVWDLAGNPLLGPLRGHQGWVSSLAYSNDGELIASGGNDSTVRIWNARTGLELYALRGHTDDVNAVAFSPNGNLLASVSDDRTIRLWSRTGEPVGQPFKNHDCYSMFALAFSPDQRRIAAACVFGGPMLGQPNRVGIWDLNGSLEAMSNGFDGHEDFVTAVGFSPDGSTIAAADYAGVVRFWDLQGKAVGDPIFGDTGRVNALAFTPDGKLLITGGEDRTVHTWQMPWPGWLSLACERLQNGSVSFLGYPHWDVFQEAQQACSLTKR